VLFVFVDGVGLGVDDPLRNPLAAAHLPEIRSLTDGRPPVLDTVIASHPSTELGCLRAVDATLGVEGRPQSGTGQTALLTGANAAALFGRHFGPWVPTPLRELLARENLFRRAAEAGGAVAFANAYPDGHMEPGGRGARRPGAFPLAAHSAGVLVRNEQSLRDGHALVSSITTDTWRRYVDPNAPTLTPAAAGRRLAAIAAEHDLTVFAHYDTDHVGHRGDMTEAIDAIEKVDAFIGGIMASRRDDVLLLVTSDHGNLEDMSAGHTTNPVPLLAVGPGHRYVADRVASIADLAPVVMELISAERGVD
jgi:2,3-bisphosphoglycerate-independent phosphoglycerate mutase